MINRGIRIIWLVKGVLGCTFGIQLKITKDYGSVTECD